MKVIYNNIIPPRGFKAVNIFGVLFVRNGKTLSQKDLRHEEIHTFQYKEMLYVFFLLWYAVEWLVRLIQYRDAHKAYRNISLEREAYANQDEFFYFETRERYAWVKYIKVKDSEKELCVVIKVLTNLKRLRRHQSARNFSTLHQMYRELQF